jgi:hypothetical protein
MVIETLRNVVERKNRMWELKDKGGTRRKALPVVWTDRTRNTLVTTLV